MVKMPVRMPDDKHARLKALALSNSVNLKKLMDELATVALANYDARVRFETGSAPGQTQARADSSRRARPRRLTRRPPI
jgi:hypothetical protein